MTSMVDGFLRTLTGRNPSTRPTQPLPPFCPKGTFLPLMQLLSSLLPCPPRHGTFMTLSYAPPRGHSFAVRTRTNGNCTTGRTANTIVRTFRETGDGHADICRWLHYCGTTASNRGHRGATSPESYMTNTDRITANRGREDTSRETDLAIDNNRERNNAFT
jgi:hypothetical protein